MPLVSRKHDLEYREISKKTSLLALLDYQNPDAGFKISEFQLNCLAQVERWRLINWWKTSRLYQVNSFWEVWTWEPRCGQMKQLFWHSWIIEIEGHRKNYKTVGLGATEKNNLYQEYTQ